MVFVFLELAIAGAENNGASWNPIEHRLFSEISKHGAGQPLTDYPTIVRLIAGTRTRTGLQVICSLSTTRYATKVRVSDRQMSELDIFKPTSLPDWNYTIFPRLTRN